MKVAICGTDAWWAEVVAKRESDPRTLKMYCAALGISVSQFHYRRKVQRLGSASNFREYALPAAAQSTAGSGVNLRFGAVTIELAPGFDADTLRAVLACCR